MAEKKQITVSERFVSRNEDELRENVQKAMDEYAVLCAQGRDFSGGETEQE